MHPTHSSRRWLLVCLSCVCAFPACSEVGTGADAPVATTINLVSGGDQIGLVGTALSEQLVVKVTDQSGAPMQGVAVAFAVTEGGGSVSPPSAASDASGLARSTWTLGPSEGAQSAQVSSTGLSGSPISFSATAVVLTVSSISPDTLVEGAEATISGTGFNVTGGNYVVTIDGAAATVTTRTATELTVTVPSSDCLPQRAADVQVSVSGTTSNTLSHPAKPAGFVNLAVGEMLLLQDPADFCLQFAPAAAGSGDFLVGMGATAETPDALLSVSMTGATGHAAPAPPFAAPVAATQLQAQTYRGAPEREALEWWRAHFEAEQRIRQWEREHLDPSRNPGLRFAVTASRHGPLRSAQAVPSVGDTLAFHVPNLDNNGGTGNTQGACDSIPIRTVVRAVGNAGIFVTDINNPATDSLTDMEIQALSDTLDNFSYPTDTLYFGAPDDLDGNQRVFVVFTVEVNKLASFGTGEANGFVFSGDLVDPSVCASSDLGEIFYMTVPDPGNAANTEALPKTEALKFLSAILAHELTHVIQFGRRLAVQGSSYLTNWEAEGQATLAMEAFAHAVLGNGPGQDYGAGTALVDGTTRYGPILSALANYYGLGESGDRIADAPEECSLYQGLVLGGTCQPLAGYGASWSFFRYVADRFGPAWTGGEAGLMRDWISANPSLAGVANVEALLGLSINSVFANWGAMHYVDGRVAAADPTLQMSSWNLADVMPALGTNAPLQPASRGFTAFSIAESLRSGSTAYSLFSGAAARPATAIRVRDGGDAILGAGMRPQVWIVRLQ